MAGSAQPTTGIPVFSQSSWTDPIVPAPANSTTIIGYTDQRGRKHTSTLERRDGVIQFEIEAATSPAGRRFGSDPSTFLASPKRRR